MGESASIGTLLELGNCAYETLQFLTSKKPSGSSEQSSTGNLHANIRVARQLLEVVLVYASTQLVMLLSKQDGEHSGEVEMEEAQQQGDSGHKAELNATTKERDRERRMRRKSLTLADRLRRGMTGEMAMDLQSLVSKAKDAVAGSSAVLGKPEPIDLLQVLISFLEDRMTVST